MGLPGRARDSFGHRPILRIVPSLGDEASADALIRLCDATHDARHRFALVLLAKSGDIRVVQWGLGHESLSSTLVYIRLRPRHVLDQWSKLSPLAGFEAGAVRALSKKRLPREDVLAAVRNAGGWVSPAELARRLGRPSGTVNRLMWCMARDGELVSDGAGKYALRRLAA